jgi:hypothetical protein
VRFLWTLPLKLRRVAFPHSVRGTRSYPAAVNDCVLCDPERSSRELMRLPVWEDDLWRLSTGDALNTAVIRGELIEEKLPNGATVIGSRDFPARAESEMRAAAETVRRRLVKA